MKRNTVLVTGGLGLIGSCLAAYVDEARYTVVVADNAGCDQRIHNLVAGRYVDLWSPEELQQGLVSGKLRPNAILHLGACTDTTEQNADFLMRNNFAYTRELAVWCLNHGVRFIYASSAATYGDGSRGYDDALEALPRLRPLNKYAFSKHAFDLWALEHGAFRGPNAITGLKYFNVYGPYESHKGEMRSMVLKAYEQIQASGAVRLFRSHRPDFADGEQRRDFLYVKDAVAMTAWFLDHPEATGIFNIGSGVERTWNDLARAVFAACGREPRIEYVEMPEAIRGAYQYSTRADLSRLRAAGCAVAARSLEEGVSDYVRNHLAPALH